MNKLPPATMITSTKGLRQAVDNWAKESLLSIDTESNSLHAYEEQVCLIQLSTRTEDFIIDPLMVEDLDPLGTLIADPDIETVFHAAEYDIMCLKRDFRFTFAGLFDTMLAARICGASGLGLASMLEQHFGVRANKKYQRANWGERPLSRDMLRYAQLDTHYLARLRDYWRNELVEMGRWEEARESFAELCEIPAAESHHHADGFWRINGAHRLQPNQIAVLRELYLYRDSMARQRDYPPFKIMGDRTLMELATLAPEYTHELQGINGMSNGQIRRYGEGVIKAVVRGKNAPPPRRPQSPRRPNDAVVARFEALRMWRKQRAQRRGVESDVIVSKDALWALARVAPQSAAELANVHELGPWKTQTYGAEILDIIANTSHHGGR